MSLPFLLERSNVRFTPNSDVGPTPWLTGINNRTFFTLAPHSGDFARRNPVYIAGFL